MLGRAKPVQKVRAADEIRAIGKYQRLTLWSLLAGFALFIPNLRMILFLPVAVLQLVMVYRLTKALDAPYAILRCLLCFVPLISLGNLFVITNQATLLLKEKGIKVGIMGAAQADLDALA